MNRFQGVVLQRLDHILDLQAHARTPTRILGNRHLAPALPAQKIRVAKGHGDSSKSRIHQIGPLPMPEVLKGICCCESDAVCALQEHTPSASIFVSTIVMLERPFTTHHSDCLFVRISGRKARREVFPAENALCFICFSDVNSSAQADGASEREGSSTRLLMVSDPDSTSSNA
jgi:hypothetical protein